MVLCIIWYLFGISNNLSQVTKYLRESISRIVSFIYQGIWWHIIVPEALNVEADPLNAEPGLEEQVQGLAGEVLPGGEQLMGEPWKIICRKYQHILWLY